LLDRGNKLANQTIHARRIDAQLLVFQNGAMQRSTALGWLDLAYTSKRLLENRGQRVNRMGSMQLRTRDKPAWESLQVGKWPICTSLERLGIAALSGLIVCPRFHQRINIQQADTGGKRITFDACSHRIFVFCRQFWADRR
jgi:hypothetical protein